jgi:hypothetical protein
MIKKFNFWFDYYIGYIMTKPTPEKLMGYHTYMFKTYGDWYSSEEQYEEHMRVLEGRLNSPPQ